MRDVEDIFGDDYEVEGQYSLFDTMDDMAPKPMIAVSKVFAAAIKQMNLAEWKTFVYALTQINWNEHNRRKVHLDKWELIKILGLKANSSDISEHLKRAIGDLWRHSGLEFSDKDADFWENGCFITRVRCYKDYVLIVFEDDYMPLFEELDKEKHYITMWSEDLFQMSSERSILFYESLRLHSDTRKTNTRIYGIKDLKQMFDIPEKGKGSYMRSKENGGFNRTGFENAIIDPICRDIEKSQMINLHILENGKPYRKVKIHGRVRGYEFSWDVSNRPQIATAKEKAELREDIDKDPVTLKIAKDIKDGKAKKEPKKNGFHNYTEGDYDIDALAKKLAQEKY